MDYSFKIWFELVVDLWLLLFALVHFRIWWRRVRCSLALSPPPPILLLHPFYLFHPTRIHSLYSHIYLTFSSMPPKVSRLWGTRFDSFNSSDPSPPPSAHLETTETLASPNPPPVQQNRNNNSDTRDQKMPHDASIFVGRCYFLSSVEYFK